jgi:hypothetical protein
VFSALAQQQIYGTDSKTFNLICCEKSLKFSWFLRRLKAGFQKGCIPLRFSMFIPFYPPKRDKNGIGMKG